MKKTYNMIYDLSSPEPPKVHERHAAKTISEYFKSDIVFIRKKSGVTPDMIVKRTSQIWELKSPLGSGKRTIANNLRDAAHQSENVILDLSRCKMNNDVAMTKLRGFLKSGDAKIRRLLVIEKNGDVLDINLKKM